jgi:hypothetical protein
VVDWSEQSGTAIWTLISIPRSNSITDDRPKLFNRSGTDTGGHRSIVIPVRRIADNFRSEIAVSRIRIVRFEDVVDAKYEYFSEFVVAVDRVFCEVHGALTHSSELRVWAVETVFEVGEITFESFDVRFEIIDRYQGETKERLVPFRHQW